MFIESGIHYFPDFDREKMPLGTISQFVCNELPRILEKAEKSGDTRALSQKVESELENRGLRVFIERVDPLARELSKLPESRDAKKLALLDLLMIDGGLHRHGLEAPLQLKAAIESLALSLGEMPTLTYDLIVRSNPPGQLRTFTGLASEKLFYRSHEKMELILEGVLSHIETGRVTGNPEAFLASQRGVKLLIQEMILFTAIIPEEFERFRPYFKARQGYRGPSGVFSANSFTLGLEIFGNDFAKRIKHVIDNIDYYPLKDRPALLQAVERASERRSLAEIAEQEKIPSEIKQAILKLAETHRDFLLAHKIVVEGFLTPADKGTGGTTGISFLKEGFEMAQGALSRLQRTLQAADLAKEKHAA